MISIGILSLLIATVQHWRSMQTLRAHYGGIRVPRSRAVFVGALMSLLGILALIAVILRH